MAIGSESAPAEFADAARTAFIYAPILSVVGAVFFGIGTVTQSGFATFLGAVGYVVAVIIAIAGIAGMIRAGQDMLARHHQASKLAIGYYERTAAAATAMASPQAESKVAPAGVPLTPTLPASAGSAPPEGQEPQSVAVPSPDLGDNVSTDPAAFVALLKSLYILDATRDVQRLYGNATCANFVNRKCEENGVPGVSLTEADIPAHF